MLRFGVSTLIFGNLFSQSFCGSFDLLGLDCYPCQFPQQFAAFLEADHRTHGARHAGERGREPGIFDP